MQQIDVCWISPSFNSYISEKIAEKIREEIEGSKEKDEAVSLFGNSNDQSSLYEVEMDDFEFSDICKHLRQNEYLTDLILPIADKKLREKEEKCEINQRRLEKPFLSSVHDEIDDTSTRSYCLWPPRSARSTSPKYNKSNSIGSCTGWSIRHLLSRSFSVGKNSPLSTSCNTEITKESKNSKNSNKIHAENNKTRISSYQIHYLKNKSKMDIDRRRSFLPYRVGILS